MSSLIQAILFYRAYWTAKQANSWLTKHNFKPIKPKHTTKNFLRYRLREPSQFKRFAIKKIPNNIELVIGFKK